MHKILTSVYLFLCNENFELRVIKDSREWYENEKLFLVGYLVRNRPGFKSKGGFFWSLIILDTITNLKLFIGVG